MLKVLLVRFVKGFVSGGLASVVALINAGVSISSLNDLRNWGFALLSAFITGGLLAVEKWYNWK